MATTEQAQAPAAETSGDAKPKRERKKRNNISIPATPELRAKLEEQAKAENTTVRALVVRQLYGQYGVSAPEPRVRTQYATPEEKKAASKARRQGRAALIKQLLEQHKAAQAAAAEATPASA